MPSSPPAPSRRSSAASRRPASKSAGALRPGHRPGRAGQLHPRGRNDQAAGKHPPRRQHRPGQRNEDRVPTAWASTSTRSSAPPPPSRSASCPITPAPASAATAFPIDPFYLTWKAREYGLHTRFIELAGEVNSAMPEWVVGKVTDALNAAAKAVKGSRILVLGIAYKKNVDDMRESPSMEIMELLRSRGPSRLFRPVFPWVSPHARAPFRFAQPAVEQGNLASTRSRGHSRPRPVCI